MTTSPSPTTYLAAYFYAPSLALAVTSGSDVLEVRQYRLRTYEGQRARELIALLAAEYAVAAIVVKPESWLAAIAEGMPRPVALVSLTEAKRLLFPANPPPSHVQLAEVLIRARPTLRRLAPTWEESGELKRSEPWRLVALVAVALGLAAARLRQGRLARSPRPTTSFTHHPSYELLTNDEAGQRPADQG